MLIQKPECDYDMVVIGAGMVGASFALALKRRLSGRIRMLVVEAFQAGAGHPGSPSFDDRSTALSFGSRRILEEIGLWQSLEESATPINTIHVSDRGHFGSTRLDCASEDVPALGYVVENRCFGHVLHEELRQQEGLDYLVPARVVDIVPDSSGMCLELSVENDSSAKLHAGLVVLADGGRSPICSRLGISLRETEYDQQAIIANIAFSQDHQNVAYERFTDSGPLAVLPLKTLEEQYRGALVWTVQGSDAGAIMQLGDAEFGNLLQERFGYRLGAITRIGKRACYPLSLKIAREQIRPGLVLLGNVAHTLHPVAGQGFNLALRDADELSTILVNAIMADKAPGEMSVLLEYHKLQQRDQVRTISFSHYLTRLFSSSRSSLVWVRKFGLASIDIVPLVKHEFARNAMGLADR